jgi:AcrR family transcriptional regulator
MAKRTARQARSKETVERIIRAGALILARGGYRALSTNAVAAKAGVGIASVYEYFDDKDEILLAVLEREMAELWLHLEGRIPRLLAGDADTALREVFSYAVREVTRRSNIVRVAAGYVHGATEFPAGVRFLGQVEMLFRLLLGRFGARPGTDATLEAYLVTHAVVGICTGIANGLPPGRTTDDVVDWLLHLAKGVLTAGEGSAGGFGGPVH